jgi:hypothetical protein
MDAFEHVEDLVDGVKTPAKLAPDMKDPVVFRPLFEQRNRMMQLYFTQETMDGFYELIEDIEIVYERQTGEKLSSIFEWNLRADEVEALIERISNPYTQNSLTNTYVRLVHHAKITPVDRAHSYGVFDKMLSELSAKCIDGDIKYREDLQMMPRDEFEVISDDLTEEEVAELLSKKMLQRGNNIKKGKKAKTEEEELQEKDELNTKIAEMLNANLVKTRIDRCEKEISLLKTDWLMANHLTIDKDLFD